mmetsp:Transcript_13588/g.38648  ORF Transcript_13588/g.38648 Transcript_13588/m.38648 type:complete len:342 (+) Transcript_13588:230-1255(+)
MELITKESLEETEPNEKDHVPSAGSCAGAGQLSEREHDAAAWRQAFREAGDGTQCPDMTRIRGLRRLIWEQTENVIRLSKRAKPPPGLPHVPLDPPARTERVVLGSLGPAPASGACRARVEQRDLLEVAGEYAAEGHSVAVLNMACAFCAGGGFRSGAGAQEENLHRRSDAVRFTEEQQKKNYPIPEKACLVSRDVTVFRGSEKDGYPFLEVPFRITLVSCAAVANPALTSSRDYARSQSRELMKAKVALIVQAAVKSQCTVAVLSAFGCGAFGNPPDRVAWMFREALERAPLKEVVFCIFDDHNAGCHHNPRGNVEPFREVFRTELGGPGPEESQGCSLF